MWRWRFFYNKCANCHRTRFMHNPTKQPLMVDVNKHNQRSWDKKSAAGESPWVQPVTPGEIAAARSGDWQVILTPTKSVPRSWFGDLKNKALLGLASGGGQQIPIFSAAGAVVTSFDQSSEQLNKDAQVAQRARDLPLSAFKAIWQICRFSTTPLSISSFIPCPIYFLLTSGLCGNTAHVYYVLVADC